MRRRVHALALAAALGCSNLTEGEGGVVGLEIRVPSPPVIETGESLQLSAVALDRDGDEVPATITWRTPDTTVTVDEGGVVTGRHPGTGRVQAAAGSLSSELVALSVIARADTLIIAGDSIVTVAPEATASGPLQVRLESFAPAGPLSGRPVIFEIVSPIFADPAARTVELPGGVLIDTLATGADGVAAPAPTVARVAGTTAPDSAIVELRSFRTRGAPVPGSGQRIIVRFQQ